MTGPPPKRAASGDRNEGATVGSPDRSTRSVLVALAQGAYYLLTGVWPLLSLRTFELVTGPKTDDWLVRTVGVLVLAVVLAVLGVLLGLVALVLTRRVRSVVVSTTDGITIEHGGERQTLRWAEVGGVRVVGHRLVLSRLEGEGSVSVLNPRMRSNPTFLALMADVQQRLDADRGYSQFM
jgi:hypothetical protein